MFLHPEQLYANKLKSSTSSLINSPLPQLDAVIIRNLTYETGRGRNKRIILNKINLTVPEGSIYGLLGPSGCGKTTMLRCVVGRIRPKSGSILVFGLRPGSGQGEVPGKAIGYMPQEISIYEDFTIEETLVYFGKINRMPDREIKGRIEFLLQFLDLPSKRRLVTNLSGGQKRRVSLAAALVHSPPLLILDEPTVGVDPLLRQSIWKHLVTLTQTERISVIITTHYIEEARQANVVGLMRHGKILAENDPNKLMRIHELTNLEDVFLKLCVTDTTRRAASMALLGASKQPHSNSPATGGSQFEPVEQAQAAEAAMVRARTRQVRASVRNSDDSFKSYSHRWRSLARKQRLGSPAKVPDHLLEASLFTRPTAMTLTSSSDDSSQGPAVGATMAANNRITPGGGYVNEAVESFSSDENEDFSSSESSATREPATKAKTNYRKLIGSSHVQGNQRLRQTTGTHEQPAGVAPLSSSNGPGASDSMLEELHSADYLALQAMKWTARRSTELNLINLKLNRNYGARPQRLDHLTGGGHSRSTANEGGFYQWWKTLMAVTWKNYVRLRRNPPVLVFQFMLPAIQVILFCLCIGGDPFDVPVAVVNDEVVPRSSQQFLSGLDKKIIRQIKYDNLTSAIDAVRRGTVWGAIHIPDKYSQNLQSRLIMGEEVRNETINNGTIRVYPDLTNLHLALALENTFRETFINFARDSLEELGYDRSLADLPIQVGKPVYGSMKKDGYLEFMAPGVVISISYVMATGLTALAFILERRDGLLERSLVSGVQTSQILLAHAINQVVVMVIQIFLVLGCTFFVFEIPSRGPFFWVVLLILLQGCTGMGFGLLVSAVCAEENTAVMMLVGTFYTNLILAGIIWPIEAMPHWLRPLSYAQPQTLPTDTLRHILSRGWGITESGVLLGFAVTIGWLVVFLMAAGLIFKYSG